MARHRILTLALLAGSAFALPAQQGLGASGIIYGPDHMFSVTAPPGWVLDNQAGRGQGLYAVFYRAGESWRSGEAVMYVNTSKSGVDSVMRQDSLRFMNRYPGLRVTARAAIRTNDSVTALVRQFVGDSSGNVEAVAYVPAAAMTPMIVLTARTQQAFESALPAFVALVKSYRFISAHVTVK